MSNMTTKLCFLHCQIQDAMHLNENLPDTDRVEQQEFNLDIEEQRRLEAMVEQEATRVMHALKYECNEALVLLWGHDGSDS